MGQQLENAKKLYLEGIMQGNYEEAVNKYTGATYIQHSTGVKDGKEGFIEFFSEFVQRNPKREIEIVRGWEDGNYSFLQAYQNINDGAALWVTTDFFRYDDNGKILEHWDVIAPFHAKTPSGHTSIDGPTEVIDLDKTEENKKLVRDLLEHALMEGGDPTKIKDYISSEKYIQHNPDVADGLEHFYKLANMPNRPLNYTDIHLVVGQGNFVATLCRATWKDENGMKEYAQVDIFRVEDGLIVEHWDNVEVIPPKEEWANSGKF
ncbi:MAG: nuclear transport factor 2 family protein [Bacteroidota bacterium]